MGILGNLLGSLLNIGSAGQPEQPQYYGEYISPEAGDITGALHELLNSTRGAPVSRGYVEQLMNSPEATSAAAAKQYQGPAGEVVARGSADNSVMFKGQRMNSFDAYQMGADPLDLAEQQKANQLSERSRKQLKKQRRRR